jgi:RNA polymerase sigma-70 factor, ECF subfamily
VSDGVLSLDHGVETRVGQTVTDLRERELVLRVQQGDTEAFDGLVRAHLRRARAIAGRLMGHPEDADDLVQEAFLRALQKIETFDPARAFGPWFIRILTNTGLDVHRRRARRPTVDDTSEVASSSPTPHQEVEGVEIRERFDRALAELPPRQRLIVWSFEVDGLDTGEIAESLGVSQVTVRWHLHQGRRALRYALADLRN